VWTTGGATTPKYDSSGAPYAAWISNEEIHGNPQRPSTTYQCVGVSYKNKRLIIKSNYMPRYYRALVRHGGGTTATNRLGPSAKPSTRLNPGLGGPYSGRGHTRSKGLLCFRGFGTGQRGTGGGAVGSGKITGPTSTYTPATIET